MAHWKWSPGRGRRPFGKHHFQGSFLGSVIWFIPRYFGCSYDLEKGELICQKLIEGVDTLEKWRCPWNIAQTPPITLFDGFPTFECGKVFPFRGGNMWQQKWQLEIQNPSGASFSKVSPPIRRHRHRNFKLGISSWLAVPPYVKVGEGCSQLTLPYIAIENLMLGKWFISFLWQKASFREGVSPFRDSPSCWSFRTARMDFWSDRPKKNKNAEFLQRQKEAKAESKQINFFENDDFHHCHSSLMKIILRKSCIWWKLGIPPKNVLI